MEDWIPYVRSFDVLATNCYGESVLHCFLFHGFYFEFETLILVICYPGKMSFVVLFAV